MATRIHTDELAEHVGRPVVLHGWLHRIRDLGGISFVLVRDSEGLAQVVLRSGEAAALVRELNLESAIEIHGEVVANHQAPGGHELVNTSVRVVAPAAQPPPFDLFRPEIPAQLPTILDHAAVSLRHARSREALRIAARSVEGFRNLLRARGFTEIFTPKIVATSTESGATVFPVDYFGRKAYLAQSPQLYKQVMVGVFERVFEVGSVFRAEPHDTTRHLTEYVSLDAEMGFIDDEHDVVSVLRGVIEGMVEAVRQDDRAVRITGAAIPQVPQSFPVVHFSDAQVAIRDATGEDLSAQADLAPAHERWLGEWAVRERESEFVVVTGYPTRKRPFYTHPDPDRPGFSRGFDLLFRGLEIVTGGQRLHRHEDYLRALSERGEPPEALAGYLEAFRHGIPPHGGFALGLERWVAQLVRAPNIRAVTAFPRDMSRLMP